MRNITEIYKNLKALEHDARVALRVASSRVKWYIRTTNGKPDGLTLLSSSQPMPQLHPGIDYLPAKTWLKEREFNREKCKDDP